MTKVVINESNLRRSGSADHEVIKQPDTVQRVRDVGFLTFAAKTRFGHSIRTYTNHSMFCVGAGLRPALGSAGIKGGFQTRLYFLYQ